MGRGRPRIYLADDMKTALNIADSHDSSTCASVPVLIKDVGVFQFIFSDKTNADKVFNPEVMDQIRAYHKSTQRKLTKDFCDVFAKGISEGLTPQKVCDLLGVTVQSYYGWLKKGEQDLEAGNYETLYAYFVEVIKHARARLTQQNIEYIQEAAKDGQWAAAAWYLERTDPEAFGKKEKLELISKFEEFVSALREVKEDTTILESDAKTYAEILEEKNSTDEANS